MFPKYFLYAILSLSVTIGIIILLVGAFLPEGNVVIIIAGVLIVVFSSFSLTFLALNLKRGSNSNARNT